MKVIAINGSPKADGNTSAMLNVMTKELEREGLYTETVHIGNKKIRGCISCYHCVTAGECIIKEDLVNDTAIKMREANGFILSSPTYFGGIAGTMKSFLDRVFFTSRSHFRYKVATAFAVVRRTGGLDVQHQLTNYLNLAEVIIPPTQYWMVAHGMNPQETLQDAEGVQTIRKNARDMAWLLKVLDAGKNIKQPEYEEKINTNFIR